ncbi:hypothetical protein [Singulisphaera sp. PoT]|uniref:hypothetical protein n=1 Tax=Singulisphaera sp. PoT TaxID=3411797 RepID=UPI003BF50BC6
MKSQDQCPERAAGSRIPAAGGSRRRLKRNRALALESLEGRIACAAGDLDLIFNGTGKEAIQVGSVGTGGAPTNDVAHAVAVQSDGKIVLAGTATVGSETVFAVARLDSDGTLDPGFGQGGIATVPVAYGGQSQSAADAESVLVQADGRIVVAGSAAGDFGQSAFAAVRLLANGQLDASFGNGGRQTIAFPGNARAYAAALQPDGKIVLAGEAQTGSGSGGTLFAVARLTSAGVPDPGFGQDGEQTVGLASGPAQDVAHAVAIQADGAIVLAGAHATGLGSSVFALARINAQGMLDASFGNAGVQTVALSAGSQPADAANAMTLQPNGAIVVAGSAGNGYGVARLTPSGDLDMSFNQTGKYVLQFPASLGFLRAGANGVVIASDGKILVAGQVGAPHADFGVIRLDADGSLDAGFADRGERMIPFDLGTSSLSDDDDEANAVALSPDGKLVVAGYASLSGGGIQASARFAVARLLTADPGNSTPPSSPPSTPAPPTAPTSPTAQPSTPVAPSKPVRPVTPAPAAPPCRPALRGRRRRSSEYACCGLATARFASC